MELVPAAQDDLDPPDRAVAAPGDAPAPGTSGRPDRDRGVGQEGAARGAGDAPAPGTSGRPDRDRGGGQEAGAGEARAPGTSGRPDRYGGVAGQEGAGGVAGEVLAPAGAGRPAAGASSPPPGWRARLADLLLVGTGAVGLLAGLAVLSMIPVLQLLTLGWLLEAEGRRARGEPWHDALPGARRAARIGSAVVGCALLALPWLVLASYARDAALIDPGSRATAILSRLTTAVGALLVLQAALASARGGRLRWFFRPFANVAWGLRRVASGLGPGAAWRAARERAAGLRLGHYLALGTRGFVAGALWLALPTALLALGQRAPALGLLGGLLLALALPWVLVAQARLAATGRFGAAFELAPLRRVLAAAPLAHAAALVLTLGLALPLYLFKLEPLPREAGWLPAGVFLVALLPTRLAAGWAYARGERQQAGSCAGWLLRLPAALVSFAAALAYVLALFFSRYFAWGGGRGLFAHHAFLLPVAFY